MWMFDSALRNFSFSPAPKCPLLGAELSELPCSLCWGQSCLNSPAPQGCPIKLDKALEGSSKEENRAAPRVILTDEWRTDLLIPAASPKAGTITSPLDTKDP